MINSTHNNVYFVKNQPQWTGTFINTGAKYMSYSMYMGIRTHMCNIQICYQRACMLFTTKRINHLFIENHIRMHVLG